MTSPLVILFLNLGSGEIFIILIFIVLFFGADKIPVMARAFGRGIREMKNATAEIQREIEKGATEVQKNMNMEQEVKTIRDAAQGFKKNIEEGIHENTGTENVKQIDAIQNDEPENPLAPPDAVKR
jgi:sec-independent protein translocase protein TatA